MAAGLAYLMRSMILEKRPLEKPLEKKPQQSASTSLCACCFKEAKAAFIFWKQFYSHENGIN
jgi:hypothetical protein